MPSRRNELPVLGNGVIAPGGAAGTGAYGRSMTAGGGGGTTAIGAGAGTMSVVAGRAQGCGQHGQNTRRNTRRIGPTRQVLQHGGGA
jgi:hypothetical protein